MKEMQKWTVTSNFIGGKYMYAVCRIKDPNQIVHSGNLEFACGYIEDLEEAKRIASNLNNFQSEHSHI